MGVTLVIVVADGRRLLPTMRQMPAAVQQERKHIANGGGDMAPPKSRLAESVNCMMPFEAQLL